MASVKFTLMVAALCIVLPTLTHCSILDDLMGKDATVEDTIDVRSLLSKLLKRENEEENNLKRRVDDVVKQVYGRRSGESLIQTRARTKEGDCKDGGRFTCANNLCRNPDKCESYTCDAFTLGPKGERYSCNCEPDYMGLYCNVSVDHVQNACSKCSKPENICYETDLSIAGLFCYHLPDWQPVNANDLKGRSVEEVKEMGRLASVIEKIMRREMKRQI